MDNLPEELFIQIIFQVIGRWNQAPERSRVMQVSPAWKRSIESCYLFWTEAVVHGIKADLQEVLLRNRDGPLEVVLAVHYPHFVTRDTLRQLAIASEHSNRWRSLSFTGESRDEVMLHFKKPTPRLRNIFFNAYAPGFMDPLRRILLSPEETPLTKIYLISTSIDWNCHRLHDIKVLRLHSLNGAQMPSLGRLGEILVASPQLQLLALSNLSSLGPTPELWPEGDTFQFLQLATLALFTIPINMLDFLISWIQAPNCNLTITRALDVSAPQSTRIVRQLESLLRRSLSITNAFTLHYDATEAELLFQDRDRDELGVFTDVFDSEERSGLSIGFKDFQVGYPGEETRQLLVECYTSFCNTLADVMAPHREFDVTLKLEAQRRLQFHWNGPPSSHPYEFPLRPLDHMPFVTHITTKHWPNGTRLLNYLSTPQTSGATGEELWPCPNLRSVELTRDLSSVKRHEVEEMEDALDRFVIIRSSTTVLQNIKIVDVGAKSSRIWERKLGWYMKE